MKGLRSHFVASSFVFLAMVFAVSMVCYAASENSKDDGSVKIGQQVWMAKTLDVTHYRNGDPILQVQDPNEWAMLTTGAWCYYENDSLNGTLYGKLYNWYAVNDPRGLAPEGWHIPDDEEWQTLVDKLGGDRAAASYLKSVEGWTPPNVGANNSSGFTALPSGYRSSGGSFRLAGTNAGWWTSGESGKYTAWYREMFSSYSAVYRNSGTKTRGFAVRCVKD
ncbi:MAG: fibrobacter succinogenes major paralogous domain-containing protein [Chlorobiales bacterium]|nr:fibrobacter succinogenes major paralogous domain-containing protein [Chlorobiales bacterium]